MFDKIKKNYAYVKSILASYSFLAWRNIFTKFDGLKAAFILFLLLSAGLYYLQPNIPPAVIIRNSRFFIEGNLLLFAGAIILLFSVRKFRSTLRALTLSDSRWFVLRVSLSVYVLGLLLVYVNFVTYKDTWVVPGHPYYYLYSAICALLVLSLVLLSMVSVKRYMPTRGTLVEDEPLDTRDNLGPYQLSALNNLEEILARQQQVNSIGLYGDWGTGKTSVYKVAKNELSQEDDRIIWVEIEPWRYTSQEALVLGFYEQIGSVLEKEIPGIQNTVNNLLGIAEPLVRKSEPFGIIETIYRWLSNLFSRGAPTPAEYISQVLEREGRYLVVAIDNIERTISTEQVYRTLQLVHFLKDSRITYVFISEKPRLLALMEAPGQTENPASYLEKFIEYEIDIFKPSTDQLNEFFAAKLSEHGVTGDSVEVPRSIIKNFETYRGVIKVLNLFVFELDKRFLRDGEYTINLGDKLQLDYLRAKYPVVWSHIEQNRDYYDEGLRDYDELNYFAVNEDERNQARRQTTLGVVERSVPNEKYKDVVDILTDLFPTLRRAVDKTPVYKDTENWLLERRVASPDILDEYFARSDSLAAYDSLVTQANSTLEACLEVGLTSDRTAVILTDFLKRARNQGNARDAVRLLIREVFRSKMPRGHQKQLLRSLMRVYAANHKTHFLDSERVLIGVLVGINQLERGLRDNPDTIKADLNYLFLNLWEFCQNPSFMLRLLLFISPGRNGDLYNIQEWGGPSTGYERYKKITFSKIKKYYGDAKNFQELFVNLGSREWSVVYHYWANSITPKFHWQRTSYEQATFIHVNRQFLEYFKLNPEIAYECLRQDFYIKVDRFGNNGSMKWGVPTDGSEKYDYPMLLETVDHLIEHGGFTTRKQTNLQQLQKSLEDTIKTWNAREAQRVQKEQLEERKHALREKISR